MRMQTATRRDNDNDNGNDNHDGDNDDDDAGYDDADDDEDDCMDTADRGAGIAVDLWLHEYLSRHLDLSGNPHSMLVIYFANLCQQRVAPLATCSELNLTYAYYLHYLHCTKLHYHYIHDWHLHLHFHFRRRFQLHSILNLVSKRLSGISDTWHRSLIAVLPV